MSKAVLCPVCGGSGKFQQGNETSGRIEIGCPCHGCSGKGWVEIDNDLPTTTVEYCGDIHPLDFCGNFKKPE